MVFSINEEFFSNIVVFFNNKVELFYNN